MGAMAAWMVLAAVPWAGTASPLIKVRPGHLPELQPSASLVAARGECQATQIVIPPPRKAVRARMEAAGLSAALYREGYVPVERPSNIEGATGLWPDPLIPVRDAYFGETRNALPADSTPDRPLVLYADVCVPPRQPAGPATPAVVLSSPGAEDLRIPISVQVEPFSLPATSTFPTSFGLSLYSLAHEHHLDPESPEARELLLDYERAALGDRISLQGLSMTPPPARLEGGLVKVDFTRYDREMTPVLEGPARFTSVELLFPRSLTRDEDKAAYARAVRAHFREKGWTALLFFYAKDEPKPSEYPLVLSQAATIHRAGDIPVLVTSPLVEELVPAADLFCAPLNCFFARSGPETCHPVRSREQFRRRLGNAKVWWYQSCLAHGCNGVNGDPKLDRAFSGWASYMIDHPGPLNRAMGPLAFENGIDGELYFDTVHMYNVGDPWKGAFAFGGNGDGTLFYPGSPDRIGGSHHVPIESLRLKEIRDGLQDYEYLHQLELRGQGELARSNARSLARSGYEIERDPAVWDRVHRALADELAKPAPVRAAGK